MSHEKRRVASRATSNSGLLRANPPEPAGTRLRHHDDALWCDVGAPVTNIAAAAGDGSLDSESPRPTLLGLRSSSSAGPLRHLRRAEGRRTAAHDRQEVAAAEWHFRTPEVRAGEGATGRGHGQEEVRRGPPVERGMECGKNSTRPSLWRGGDGSSCLFGRGTATASGFGRTAASFTTLVERGRSP